MKPKKILELWKVAICFQTQKAISFILKSDICNFKSKVQKQGIKWAAKNFDSRKTWPNLDSLYKTVKYPNKTFISKKVLQKNNDLNIKKGNDHSRHFYLHSNYHVSNGACWLDLRSQIRFFGKKLLSLWWMRFE